MPPLTRALLRWLPLAVLTTALSALSYLVIQQMGRQLADEPQVQMARDAAAALATGRSADGIMPAGTVDLGQSLAPFVMVLDDKGAALAASGRLGARMPAVPAGVLDHVRRTGEERVTWQPEPGVRLATVVVRRTDPGGGFVASGRSLRETEERIARIQTIVLLAWLVTLAGSLLFVAAGEYFINRA